MTIAALLMPALVAAALLLSLGLSTTQSLISSRVGTDHPVHRFIIDGIRHQHMRLFVRIPRLLNDCYVGALPLYLHWIVAQLPVRSLYWCERLLNPALNAVQTGLFVAIACLVGQEADLPPAIAGIAACAFALTPQFFHAFSARNFGLSARGMGLALLTGFLLCAHVAQQVPTSLPAWTLLVVLGWLIFGFSTFALQALVLLSALMLVVGHLYAPAIGVAGGLALFVLLHPRYATGYLRHTYRFLRTYAAELAPIYVLARRYSVWRDLVWDVWRRLPGGLASAGRYAYENSVIIVLALNPFVVYTAWDAIAQATGATAPAVDGPLLGYARLVTLTGLLAFGLTSLRMTRFLGEPERYVEAITPWAVAYGSVKLAVVHGAPVLVLVVLAFLVLDGAQLLASRLLSRHVGGKNDELAVIQERIGSLHLDDVRFLCNNEQLTKLMMANDWQFCYCLAVGNGYSGMTITQAFSAFPFLTPSACARLATVHRVNVCLLDRSVGEQLYADVPPADLAGTDVIYESPRLRLIRLRWRTNGEGQ